MKPKKRAPITPRTNPVGEEENIEYTKSFGEDVVKALSAKGIRAGVIASPKEVGEACITVTSKTEFESLKKIFKPGDIVDFDHSSRTTYHQEERNRRWDPNAYDMDDSRGRHVYDTVDVPTTTENFSISVRTAVLAKTLSISGQVAAR